MGKKKRRPTCVHDAIKMYSCTTRVDFFSMNTFCRRGNRESESLFNKKRSTFFLRENKAN